MTWEYLDSSEFEIRYKMVAAYLTGREMFSGNVIDLNCGKYCPLRFELNGDEIKKYYGNDINLESKSNYSYELLRKIPDIEVINDLSIYMTDVNTLVLLGDGAGHLTGETQESPTSLPVFFEIIDKYNPQTVVYEIVKRFEEEYGLFSQVKCGLLDRGYRVSGFIELDIKPELGFVSQRMFGFYEKGE